MTKAAQQSEWKKGTCRWCDKKGEVYRNNGLCDDCDSRVIHCTICKQDQHEDSHCRHVFRDRYFEWNGAGVRVPTKHDVRLKTALFTLLGVMPPRFADDLKSAIRSAKFHTWTISPMIGGGGILQLHGMPYDTGTKYGDAILEIGGGEHANDTADGYRWLVSLYDGDTPDANRVTVRWINAWKRQPKSEGAPNHG
jgi:hypothetical protein